MSDRLPLIARALDLHDRLEGTDRVLMMDIMDRLSADRTIEEATQVRDREASALYAGTPDLLAALERVTAHLHFMVKEARSQSAATADALAAAHAAIAKATGEV